MVQIPAGVDVYRTSQGSWNEARGVVMVQVVYMCLLSVDGLGVPVRTLNGVIHISKDSGLTLGEGERQSLLLL